MYLVQATYSLSQHKSASTQASGVSVWLIAPGRSLGDASRKVESPPKLTSTFDEPDTSLRWPTATLLCKSTDDKYQHVAHCVAAEVSKMSRGKWGHCQSYPLAQTVRSKQLTGCSTVSLHAYGNGVSPSPPMMAQRPLLLSVAQLHGSITCRKLWSTHGDYWRVGFGI